MGMTAEYKAAWLAQRCGKLTGSRTADAISFRKDGKPTAERTKYMTEIVAERLTGDSIRHYVTDEMQWGLDHEDEAVDWFVYLSGRKVLPALFYDHPTIDNFGATPDRLIGDDGLLEVKCPTTTTFLNWIKNGVVPEEYKPQMTAELVCTGRKWVGFIAYDPRIKDERRRMFMRKFVPTAEYIEHIETQAVKFLAEVDALFELVTTAK